MGFTEVPDTYRIDREPSSAALKCWCGTQGFLAGFQGEPKNVVHVPLYGGYVFGIDFPSDHFGGSEMPPYNYGNC